MLGSWEGRPLSNALLVFLFVAPMPADGTISTPEFKNSFGFWAGKPLPNPAETEKAPTVRKILGPHLQEFWGPAPPVKIP